MPMISTTGRKELRVRIIIWSIYLALTLGSVTMVYPFLLMLSGSSKSGVDSPDARVIPLYLVDDLALYRKHIEGMMNEATLLLQNAYGDLDGNFRRLEFPKETSPLLDDWREFLSETEIPSYWYYLGYIECVASRGSIPYQLANFRSELLRENKTIDEINLKYKTSFPSVTQIIMKVPNFLLRFQSLPENPYTEKIAEFSRVQPGKWRNYVSMGNHYREYLKVQYGRDVSAYNEAKGTSFASWMDVPMTSKVKDMGAWALPEIDYYIRRIANPIWVRFSPDLADAYRHSLNATYKGDIARLNQAYGTTYADFSEIPMPEQIPNVGTSRLDWSRFLEGWVNPETGEEIKASLDQLFLDGPDFQFQAFLEKKYGSIETLNEKTKQSLASFGVIQMPQISAQYEDFLQMRGWLKWEFSKRNYETVWSYLIVNGRGMFNTIIYCGLSILAALTVDPIAAYALSRFKPASSFKVLLFLMMTMAFPAMVTQIPIFLLLRDLHMLNTFWALILPGLANGYHIFLLKGFFDSLPQELYESAEIDGASEVTIFLNITMSLSKPILAVMALYAFTGAYAAFMFALLLCQDPQMWTLMVWLYQLQANSGQGIIFSSLIIAAIPTFIVFVFCQNIIMQGIVVPVEK